MLEHDMNASTRARHPANARAMGLDERPRALNALGELTEVRGGRRAVASGERALH